MTAIVMVDGIAYTRKEGVPCYDSGLGWRECQSDESHLAGALVDAQDELATLRADLATSRAALEDVLWQEAHPNVEVVSRRRAEDDEKLWVAYDRSGNVNDTEWFAIAEGDTWKEALRNARRALAQEAERPPSPVEAAPPPVDDRASRRAADLLISHFGGQSLEDAVEKAVAVRYMKREEGIIPPWEMLVPSAPARRTITREEFNAARVLFLDEDMTSSEVMTAVAAAWRLTVEDA